MRIFYASPVTTYSIKRVILTTVSLLQGNPYCKKCHTNFMPLCAGCNSRIEGASQWISALSKDWHNGCFTCSVCTVLLPYSA